MSQQSGTSTATNSPEFQVQQKKENIADGIARIITEIIEENQNIHDDIIKSTNNLETSQIFMGKKIPSITILQFLERIIKYSNMEDSTLIIILIFLDRYCEINQLRLNYMNIHRLILASALLAIKYNEDDFYSNEFYAKVGGINTPELNLLEREFLSGIEYTLFVEDNIYDKYQKYLLHYNYLK